MKKALETKITVYGIPETPGDKEAARSALRRSLARYLANINVEFGHDATLRHKLRVSIELDWQMLSEEERTTVKNMVSDAIGNYGMCETTFLEGVRPEKRRSTQFHYVEGDSEAAVDAVRP